MGSNLTLNKEIEEYINNNSLKLHDVQKEIIIVPLMLYLLKI